MLSKRSCSTLLRAVVGPRSLSSPATVSNFVSPSVYPRCGSRRSNWLENSYPRIGWRKGMVLIWRLGLIGKLVSRSEGNLFRFRPMLMYRNLTQLDRLAPTVTSVLVSGFNVSSGPHLHIPHMAEKWAGGEGLVSRPRVFAPR